MAADKTLAGVGRRVGSSWGPAGHLFPGCQGRSLETGESVAWLCYSCGVAELQEQEWARGDGPLSVLALKRILFSTSFRVSSHSYLNLCSKYNFQIFDFCPPVLFEDTWTSLWKKGHSGEMKNFSKAVIFQIGIGSPWTCLVSIGLLGIFEGCAVMIWCYWKTKVKAGKAALSEWEEVAGGEAVDGWRRGQVHAIVGKLQCRAGKEAENFARAKRSVFQKEMFCEQKHHFQKSRLLLKTALFFHSSYGKKASTYFKHFKILSVVVLKCIS